jgi:cytochrome c-type biogenesis protein CcmE
MVTDNIESIKVTYEGILPDLFREGQGVVASGSVLNKCVRWTCANTFIASEVLAKHDENYMPPEVAAALEISSSQ